MRSLVVTGLALALAVAPGRGAAEEAGHLGVLFASSSADVSSGATGKLADVRVRLGDRVRRGDTLAVLDDRDVRLSLTMAEADLESARASVTRADAELALAIEALARRQRAPELFSAEEVSRAREQERAARAGLDATRAAVRRHVARVAQLGDEVGRTRITAPFDGTIAARYREPGEFVLAGAPLLRVGGTAGLWVRFAVPPAAASTLRIGQRVMVRVGDSSAAIGGEIRQIAHEVDAASNMVFAEAVLDTAVGDGTPLVGRTVRVTVSAAPR